MTLTLKDLEKEYNLLAKKYGLEDFNTLNNDFEIEKIDSESKCLLRLIRKVMMEKVVNLLSFIEILLNPVGAPRMYMVYLKSMTLNDKKEIEKIYGMLSELVLSALEIEMEYEEKREAEVIKLICEKWDIIKPSYKKIINDIKMPKLSNGERGKSYFG
ncbi:MAG: hypothetical protein N3D20_00860 [Candidatus Pacearchaeota archaeon]|nr:hypothetical protein [Candidatus Pacearchaeota archaeon]